MNKWDAFLKNLWPAKNQNEMTPEEKRELELWIKANEKSPTRYRDSIFVYDRSEITVTIQDDVYWLEANLRIKRGEFEAANTLLGKITADYGDDILADDAYFTQGDIYEHYLKNKDKAMEIYRDFLDKYPGSVYAAEARKRFRTLRGDFQEKVIN